MTGIVIDVSADIRESSKAQKAADSTLQYFLKKHVIWLFSILIHSVIVVVASVTRPAPAPPMPPTAPPLAAHLYQPRPAPPVTTQTPTPVAPDLPISAPSAAKSINDTARITDALSLASSPEPSPIKSPDTPSSMSLPASTPPVRRQAGKKVLRRFMAQHNATALQGLAGQQAASFQHRKISPELIETRTLDEIQAPAAAHTTQVRCDNTLNTALTTLSVLAGGTLVCSQRKNHHDEFIKRQRNPELRD